MGNLKVLLIVSCCLLLSGFSFLKEIKSLKNPGSKKDIEFVREESFGETEEVLLGDITGVVVDSTDRVYLADEDQLVVHVYNPDGSYLKSLGRKGRGPGEFQNLEDIKIHSDQLWAVDGNPIPTRINIYSLESLSFTETIRLRAKNINEFDELAGYTPNSFYPLDDGTFIVSYQKQYTTDDPDEIPTRYYLQNKSGEIISDQLLEQKNNLLVEQITPTYTVAYGDFPFIGGSVFALSNEGYIYSARTEEFLVKVYDRDGDHLYEFEHPIIRKKMNRDEIMEIAANETREQVIANNDLPEKWPSLESMLFDDKNQLWVSTIIENINVREWWILQDDGTVVSKFTWPVNNPIEVVINGYMYARETDEETGLQQIVKYRIEME